MYGFRRLITRTRKETPAPQDAPEPGGVIRVSRHFSAASAELSRVLTEELQRQARINREFAEIRRQLAETP